MKCRHCAAPLQQTVLDLGSAPPSNALLSDLKFLHLERSLPLQVRVCERCWLVQTVDCIQADEIFDSDYPYLSSTSRSWLDHVRAYSAKMIQQFRLGAHSLAIEVASNDGYLLQYFLEAGVPCLGIEPAASVAEIAERKGVPVVRQFLDEDLGLQLSGRGVRADLLIANNVYAHVPDINSFTRGLAALLKPGGVLTLEFPHLLNLIQQVQFDTVYHEHYSYLSLSVVQRIFASAGLRVWDVEKLPTHGGSLRVYGCKDTGMYAVSDRVEAVLALERSAGLERTAAFAGFQVQADRIRDGLLNFLWEQKHAGKRVVGYGAAAKGNTLLNYAGVTPELLPFVCDAAPSKQGKFLPGSHIPIVSPDCLRESLPDYVLILPWNLAREVQDQFCDLQGVQFVTAIPRITML